MAVKKVGALVKEARTAAGLTQEKLAKAAGEGLAAADIGKCERGEADLTSAQLKAIAKACGVTQKSLAEAPKNLSATAKKTNTAAKSGSAAKASSSSKSSSAKAGTGKNASSKTASASAKKTASASKKSTTPANANISLKVTSTEQKLIEAYRASTSDRKKAALKLLNGEYGDTIDKILSVTNGTTASSSASSASSSSSSAADMVGEMLGNVLGSLLGGK